MGEVWQALFGSPLQVHARPFTAEDIDVADTASQFVRWSLDMTLAFPDWAEITKSLIFDALLDSVGVAKVMAWEPPWLPPSPDARRFLRRTVRIDPLDLGQLLVAPDAESLQFPACRFIAQEFFLTSDDLIRMSRRGFDTPDWDELGDSQQLTERKRVELEREGERVVEFRPDSILFLESYERFTLNDDIGDEDVIVSWFPDAQIVGTSHNLASNHGRIAGVRTLTDVFPQDDRPRRPFFPVTFWPQPRQWRGLNVPDRLESMQDLINRLHEQLVNYGEVSMLPFVFVNTFLTGEIPDLRTVRPGSTVPIDDISGVNFAPTRSLNRHFAEQIQMMQANVERDSGVTDFNLGRQSSAANAPRTASATMALLQQSRKSYGMLVRHAATQFSHLLSFHFRLWQAILPDDTYASIFPANLAPSHNTAPIGDNSTSVALQTSQESPESSALWDRIFTKKSLSDTGRAAPDTYVALPISKDNLSGFFDIKIEVNPEQQFDQQVLMQLFQITAPALQDFPVGSRLMLKRIWSVFDQHGFDDIYPEEVAMLQTQQRLLAVQVQLATFEQQLAQIQQAAAQQKLQALNQAAQQFHQTGQAPPELQAFAEQFRQGQSSNGQPVAPQPQG